MAKPVASDIWKWVSRGPEDSCWLYRGSRSPTGYGRFYWYSKSGKREQLAHRAAWQAAHPKETLQSGANVQIMHSCDNPPCCNPKHLSRGSALDNVQDKYAKGRGGDHGKGRRRTKHDRPRKLTPEQVREIRASKETQSYLSRLFSVSRPTIQNVRKRRTFDWVK